MISWTTLSWVLTSVAIVLLIWAALHDLAARTVPNAFSAAILVLGLSIRMIDHSVILSLVIAFAIFVLLFAIWLLGVVGGGDVKLWAASVVLIPPHWQLELSVVARILLTGGVLALIYLSLRFIVSKPRASHSGNLVTRVLRVEAWRICHKGPLPYAFAIASGTILTLLPFSLSAPR